MGTRVAPPRRGDKDDGRRPRVRETSTPWIHPGHRHSLAPRRSRRRTEVTVVGVPEAALGPELWTLLARLLATAAAIALITAVIVRLRSRRRPLVAVEPPPTEPGARRFL